MGWALISRMGLDVRIPRLRVGLGISGSLSRVTRVSRPGVDRT